MAIIRLAACLVARYKHINAVVFRHSKQFAVLQAAQPMWAAVTTS